MADNNLTDTETLNKDDILDSLMDESSDKGDAEITEIDLDESDNDKKDDKSTNKKDDDKTESSDEDDDTNESDDDKEKEIEEIELKEEDELEYKDVPKRQEILKAYPDIFKKFPGVERAIYREQQYAEVFPTIADAKAANESLGTLKQFEQELLSGSIAGVLSSVKNTDPRAFNKITGEILQTIAKVDEKAYYGTLNYVLKNALHAAFSSGKQSDDEQLQIASQLLHKFIYGTTEVTLLQPDKVEQPNPREIELNKREQQFTNQQLNLAVNDVTTRTDNVIKSAIDKHIDPRGVMTSYVRNKASEDVIKMIQKEITSDTRFVAIKDKLWEAAVKDGFSEASKVKIRNALLSKAKTVLPGIIQKVKADALKGQATRSKSASESKDERPLASGKSASPNNSSSGSKSSKKEVPHNMKTLDYLMSD